MTERMAKVIKSSMTKEDEVIGNLKNQFVKKTVREQRYVQISPALVAGNIALAYHRGLAEGQRDVDYWKNRYLKLKAKQG